MALKQHGLNEVSGVDHVGKAVDFKAPNAIDEPIEGLEASSVGIMLEIGNEIKVPYYSSRLLFCQLLKDLPVARCNDKLALLVKFSTCKSVDAYSPTESPFGNDRRGWSPRNLDHIVYKL